MLVVRFLRVRVTTKKNEQNTFADGVIIVSLYWTWEVISLAIQVLTLPKTGICSVLHRAPENYLSLVLASDLNSIAHFGKH